MPSRRTLIRLPVAQRLQRFTLPGNAGFQEGVCFFQQTVLEHLRCTAIEAVIKLAPVRGQSDLQYGKALERLPRMALNRKTGQFNRPNQLLMVVGVNTSGRGQVPVCQVPMEDSGAASGKGAQSRTQAVIALRSGREPFQQSTQVKTRAADKYRKRAALPDLLEHRPGEARVSPRRQLFCWRDYIYKMMRNPAPFALGKLGRANIESAMNLHRVEVDDFAAQLAGQRQRKVTLATTGLAEYRKEG